MTEGKAIFVPGVESDGERPVSFRFSPTWSSLFVLLEPAKLSTSIAPLNNRARIEPEVEPAPPMDRPTPASPGSDVNWEMVVPKMVRPVNRAAASRETTASPAATPPSSQSPSTPAKPPYMIREYQLGSGTPGDAPKEPEFSPPPRSSPWNILRIGLGVAALAALGLVVWAGTDSPRAKTAVVESTPGQSGWERQADTAEAGSKQKRQLIMYRPSLNSTDGELEFNWNAGGKSVGWVFRVRDAANYYAMRLKVLSGHSPALAAEHFIVSGGKESPHYERMLALPAADATLRVRMTAMGSEFRLYLQGAAEDYWTDTTLVSGGLGFFEERNQPVEVQSVRLAFSEVPESNFAATRRAMTKWFQ